MKNLQTLGDRVRYAREKLDLTQPELGRLAGYTQQGIADIEAGDSERPRKLKKLANALKVTPQWLEYGAEAMNSEEKTVPITYVPILEWGQIISGVNSSTTGTDLIPMFVNCSEKTYALRVKGDSMTSPHPSKANFMDGDVLIVDPDVKPKANDFIIALQENAKEPIFKQFIIEGNKEYLRSLNPQYPLIEIDKSITILGVIICKQVFY